MEIQPTLEHNIAWIEKSDFRIMQVIDMQECYPHHYGIVAFP